VFCLGIVGVAVIVWLVTAAGQLSVSACNRRTQHRHTVMGLIPRGDGVQFYGDGDAELFPGWFALSLEMALGCP